MLLRNAEMALFNGSKVLHVTQGSKKSGPVPMAVRAD